MNLFIIAEAGINHNGDISIAEKLIIEAANAGADAIKFQAAIPSLVCIKNSPLAEYQKNNNCEDQLKLLSELHLPLEKYEYLRDFALEKGIEFMCSAFDCESLDYINNLGVRIHKIASGEITHYPFLKKVASYNKPTIVSTGMATLIEVENCYNLLLSNGLDSSNIILMHCTTNYPADFEDVNLLAIRTMSEKFNCPIGYSDHTIGNEISIAALALGCTYFEKHFTLDKDMEGPDHKASLSLSELNEYIQKLRKVFLSFGDGIKKPFGKEISNKLIVRRSIFAKKKIKKGEIFNEDNLICKRPSIGIDSMKWNSVIGQKSVKDFDLDEPISL